jgi:hypothetical protein
VTVRAAAAAAEARARLRPPGCRPRGLSAMTHGPGESRARARAGRRADAEEARARRPWHRKAASQTKRNVASVFL